jgi:hypothetical protein
MASVPVLNIPVEAISVALILAKVTFKRNGKIEQVATGRNIFDNQWQSFKTNSEKIELISSKFEYPKPGKYKIAVKVIDVFGNDTTRIFEVNVGK